MHHTARLFLASQLAIIGAAADPAGLHAPLAGTTPAPARPRANTFDDATLHVALPLAWRMEGAGGEYRLQSEGPDAASLLLLLADPENSLPERLAAIEEQFVATGIIVPDTAASRREDGAEIFYRRYRLIMGGAEEESGHAVILHQYSFERAGVPVLLQVETEPGRAATAEDLFFRIFHTLEIHEAPAPFVYEDPQAASPEPRSQEDRAPDAATPR